MTKKIVSIGAMIGVMFMFIGCGGGSDDAVPTAPTTTAPASSPIATGIAYYVDSAVSGVNYTCGSQKGITDADGGFTFEVGGRCTFYLDDIILRGVDAALLEDGATVYETNVWIARILQSLDSDGNPDNGITINTAIVQALADAGITELPDTPTEMDEMLQVIKENGGIVVSEVDAQTHMLTTILVSKTLYQHCKDSDSEWIATLAFQVNGEVVIIDEGGEDRNLYRINGNLVYTIEDGQEKIHTLSEVTTEYIAFTETSGETTIFYFSKEEAEAAPATDCGGDNTPADNNDTLEDIDNI